MHSRGKVTKQGGVKSYQSMWRTKVVGMIWVALESGLADFCPSVEYQESVINFVGN